MRHPSVRCDELIALIDACLGDLTRPPVLKPGEGTGSPSSVAGGLPGVGPRPEIRRQEAARDVVLPGRPVSAMECR